MTDFKQIIKAESFYQCRTKKALRQKFKDEGRMSVLYGMIRRLGESISSGTVEKLYDELERYDDSWFSFDYLKEQAKRDDRACFERFLKYLGNVTITDFYTPIEVETPLSKVFGHVDFVAFKDGRYTAYIIHFKKADKSPYGKSVHTNSESDVEAFAAKAYFETKYPGIDVALVYLCQENDTIGSIGPFVSNKTRKSNIFVNSYQNFYDDGIGFNMGLFLNEFDRVLQTNVEPNCFNCDVKDLCQQNTVKQVSKAKPKAESTEQTVVYALPEYTESQKKVINKTDGPVLVCAGPGSGKTATLVGRIRHLIEMGVEPEFILAITFTKDAAGELRQRCMSFCEPYSMPEILTLNALGYKLLKLNPDYAGEINLMTKRDRISLISSLLEITKPLEGFNYAQIKGGNGLLSKLDKSLTSYQEGCRDFKADFLSFAETFEKAVEAKHFITYDEQISLAQKMFLEYPDVLDGISSRYKYIMVDEFQDVNEEQVSFIKSLSSKYKNICCVGDDDQSIYAFRGASNKYMLGFKEMFPDAVLFTLRENFRSKEEILKAAGKCIAGNKRIKKELVPTRKGGLSPIHVKGQSLEDLESVVKQITDSGVAHEDIAVIASKNATLENLQRQVSFPSVLGREFLIDSPLFKTVFWSLKAYLGEDVEKATAYLQGLVCSEESVTKILSIKDCTLAMKFSEQVAAILGLEETAAFDSLCSVIISEHCQSLDSLLEVMQYMCDFSDDTRINPDTTDQVVFITSHESKGMEWKAVVMIDDYKDEASEEQNRLLYVAMTRAKDILYILDDTRKGSVIAA